MADCGNCAGTGTTIIAVIALILVIVFIIVLIVLYFYPSNQTLLEIRGTNFNIKPGKANGASGNNTDTFDTGSNNIYISNVLTGPINLTINPNTTNFVGLTIAVKNVTPSTSTGNTITLQGASGLTIDNGGITNGNIVLPSGFAWLICTSAVAGSQKFLRLE